MPKHKLVFLKSKYLLKNRNLSPEALQKIKDYEEMKRKRKLAYFKKYNIKSSTKNRVHRTITNKEMSTA